MIDRPIGSDVRTDDGSEPIEHCTPKLELLRVLPGKPLAGIILDENPLKVFTHWWGSRTIPCRWVGCEACAAHRKPEWHAYFTIYQPRTCGMAVVEVTAACRETMARWESLHVYWRGAMLTARRIGNEKNSRLSLAISAGNLPVETLPPPIDLMDYMCRMWGSNLRGNETPAMGDRAYNASLTRAGASAIDEGLIRQHP